MQQNDKPLARPPSEIDEASYLLTYGEIYEDSQWIAKQVWQQGIDLRHDTVLGLHSAFSQAFLNAPRLAQLQVLGAHPDLAVGSVRDSSLSSASSAEQTAAGLNRCNDEQRQEFQFLNASYRRKFGFPFIMAVGGFAREDILQQFRERSANSTSAELRTALREVNKIALLRLEGLAQ